MRVTQAFPLTTICFLPPTHPPTHPKTRRPNEAFTTDRAQRAGRANAASGRIMVTVPNDHFGPILPEHDPESGKVRGEGPGVMARLGFLAPWLGWGSRGAWEGGLRALVLH